MFSWRRRGSGPYAPGFLGPARETERERVNGVWGRGGVPANMGGKP